MQKSKDVKVVLLGDSGVGKSSILIRFVSNEFKPSQESTLGAAFMAKMIIYKEQAIKFQIWDTAGQEKYHSLAPLYYKDSNVALIVYDITSKNSFEVLKNWIKELKSNGPKNTIIALVGNKVDLVDQEEVNYDEAVSYAKDLGALFQLTSAKENKGIEDLFNKIAEQMEINSNKPDVVPGSPNKGDAKRLANKNKEADVKKGCC